MADSLVTSDFWSALLAERKAHCDALRDAGPVVEIDGIYYLTRHTVVLEAFHNPEVFASVSRDVFPGFDVIDLPPIPTGLNPPEHTRYRDVLQPLFSPGPLKALLPTLTGHARALIDAVAASGQCDAMEAVTAPYAVAGLHAFCGLPQEHAVPLHWWRCAMATEPRGSASYLAAVFNLFAYLADAIRQRRENPNIPGVLGRLPDLLSDEEAIAASFTVFGGGAANEANTAGFALAALAADPRLRELLRDDPEQTRTFVGEILRLEPPVQALPRVTAREVTVGGVTIPAGAQVRLHLGCINREDSDDITVTDGRIVRHPHWTFGAGPHRCPAANLARTELTVLVNEWLRRIPDFELEDSPPIPEKGTGLPSLPLRWNYSYKAATQAFS